MEYIVESGELSPRSCNDNLNYGLVEITNELNQNIPTYIDIKNGVTFIGIPKSTIDNQSFTTYNNNITVVLDSDDCDEETQFSVAATSESFYIANKEKQKRQVKKDKKKWYKCRYCFRKFKSEKILLAHQKYNSSLVCHLCKKKFCKKKILDKHVCGTFQCDICQKELLQLHYMSHMRRHETSNMEKNITGRKPKYLQCSACVKRYSCHSSLQRHIKQHREKDQLQINVS